MSDNFSPGGEGPAYAGIGARERESSKAREQYRNLVSGPFPLITCGRQTTIYLERTVPRLFPIKKIFQKFKDVEDDLYRRISEGGAQSHDERFFVHIEVTVAAGVTDECVGVPEVSAQGYEKDVWGFSRCLHLIETGHKLNNDHKFDASHVWAGGGSQGCYLRNMSAAYVQLRRLECIQGLKRRRCAEGCGVREQIVVRACAGAARRAD
ncbi:hypothetical protein EVAR_50722_1 [Eumeta japonica]|uniref:Uncharacterized protein n=1 Tax=Eumeta variegata TaxID=151549 RepID=A0A4C1YLF9_EUMVA|nr:hypothetical protein EVAR_50722_1 [Eumeta japonica]